MLKIWSRCALVGFGSTRPLQLLSKIGSKLMTGQIVLLDTLGYTGTDVSKIASRSDKRFKFSWEAIYRFHKRSGSDVAFQKSCSKLNINLNKTHFTYSYGVLNGIQVWSGHQNQNNAKSTKRYIAFDRFDEAILRFSASGEAILRFRSLLEAMREAICETSVPDLPPYVCLQDFTVFIDETSPRLKLCWYLWHLVPLREHVASCSY